MENNRKGFSLVELITACVLMAVLTGVATIGLTAANQTPKREAQRIAAYLAALTEKADRMKLDFKVKLDASKLDDRVGDRDLDLKFTVKTSGNKFFLAKLSVTWKDKSNTELGSEEDLVLDNELIYNPHFNANNINDTDTREWTYEYGERFKIAAISSLSSESTTGYNYHQNGHRYLAIASSDGALYYVVITDKDTTDD